MNQYMNDQEFTVANYQQNFQQYKNMTPNSVGNVTIDWLNNLVSRLSKGSKIIELGSAHGRDAKFFCEKDLNTLCTDVIEVAILELQKNGFDAEYYDYNTEFKSEWLNNFDAIFANAVLLHAKRENINQILTRLCLVIKKDGLFALSLKIGKGEEISFEKMPLGRFFTYYTIETFSTFVPENLELVYQNITDDKKWLQLIYKKLY
jgi:2-polyprenyl-3-methyl-5-hydroxy-6-metoxy-1,4-benzoquinol methylase